MQQSDALIAVNTLVITNELDFLFVILLILFLMLIAPILDLE